MGHSTMFELPREITYGYCIGRGLVVIVFGVFKDSAWGLILSGTVDAPI